MSRLSCVVIAMLDKLAVERCIIGGNSLGGAVAWRTALAHPCRVQKLILVDAGGYPYHPVSVPIGFRLAQIPALTWLLKNTLPRSLVEQGRTAAPPISSPGKRDS